MSHITSGGRYPVLRALAIMYLIMAGLAVIGGLITAGYVLWAYRDWSIATRIVWSIVSLAGTFFAVVGLLAIAEVLKLFIDIEHNTRTAALAGAYQASTTPAVSTTVAGAPAVVTTTSTSTEGGRLSCLDEETAEAALIRGH
jgi:hypothetical protein